MKRILVEYDITGATERYCYAVDGGAGKCYHCDLNMQYRCPLFGYLRTEIVGEGYYGGRAPVRPDDCLAAERRYEEVEGCSL